MAFFLGVVGLWLSASAQSRPYYGQGYSNGRLTGTWRLNASRGDDPRMVAERATRNLDVNDRQRAQENLMRRLGAPDELAIDRRGRTVTMASSRGPQVTFEADGIETTETMRSGRERHTRATLMGDQLTVRTVGDRGSDYVVVFEPLDGGRRLRVTRSLYTDRLNQVVVARSVYDRESDVAQFNLNLDRDLSYTTPSRSNFSVPDGVFLTARLNQQLSTRQTRQGERFTLNVVDPGQYRGAVIEGVVTRTDRSGRASGRADMTLDFESIRMRDGRTYDFAGTIENALPPNGERVRVDREGNVEQVDSRTSSTVSRSAIGGAIGALIGA
ncbi:MAG TPA: hypothetical protein VKD91_15880, partial [Pyrinomonadaceae bacterium]|nr:hypothetical protein [Pyrinomonadaceae bacterium]